MKYKWPILIVVGLTVVFFLRRANFLGFMVKGDAVLPSPLKATTARILDVVSDVWNTQAGVTAVVTSGTDSTHIANSKHYSGDALDFRTSNVPASKLQAMVQTVRGRLGNDYDVILESDHLHVEYDPK